MRRRTLETRRGISWALCNTVNYGNRAGAKQGGCPPEKMPHVHQADLTKPWGEGTGSPEAGGKGNTCVRGNVLCRKMLSLSQTNEKSLGLLSHMERPLFSFIFIP